MATPGAKSDMKDAVFENDATTSSLPTAPTLIAEEMHPGVLNAFVNPLFPAAMAVAIRADRRLSMMGFIGSPSQGAANVPPPRLRFTDAMFLAPRTAYTRSRPAMRSDVQACRHGAALPHSSGSVNSENTWTAMIWAPLATPENVAPLPAAIPATWVPCQHSPRRQGRPAPEPVCSLNPFGHTEALRLETV